MRLEAKDVACGWEKGKPVQKFVSFTVDTGEVCCILGPNGCGKSTLLKTLMGILPRLGGRVTLDGKDIRKYSPKERSRVMAYVSQGHTPPFAYKVRDVVMLGRIGRVGLGQPSAKDRQIAETALEDMGVRHLRDEFYTDISGGELQLVMIARALTQQPQILILDEPTAALDYGNAMRVVAKIHELAERGFGVLMTTHSPDHALMLDSNVVLLQKERPMQFGHANHVITEKNMRDAYGVDVETKEFLTRDGQVMRLCAPAYSNAARGRKAAGVAGDEGATSTQGAPAADIDADATKAAG